MFAIEFVYARLIAAGNDREDLHWHRCTERYPSLMEAEEDAKWMAAEEPALEFRVVPVFEHTPPANDNGGV